MASKTVQTWYTIETDPNTGEPSVWPVRVTITPKQVTVQQPSHTDRRFTLDVWRAGHHTYAPNPRSAAILFAMRAETEAARLIERTVKLQHAAALAHMMRFDGDGQ